MSRVSKNFKLSLAAVKCIEELRKNAEQNGNKFTQTDIVEQALFNYLVEIKGEKELSRIIIDSVK